MLDTNLGTTDFKIVHYGKDYTFYACENLAIEGEYSYELGLVAMTEAEYKLLQIPVYDRSDWFSLYDRNSKYKFMIDSGDYLSDGNEAKITASGTVTELVYKSNVVAVNQLNDVLPVYDESNSLAKLTMIGQAAVPEDCTILETGFIFATDMNATDLTVENVDNTSIFRYKTSKITVGNQFAINIINPAASVEFQYSAYVILKDANGKVSTYYAAPVAADNQV